MKWSRLESPGYYFFLLLSSERSKLLEFSALYPLPFPTNTTISTLTEQGKSSSELAPLWVGPAVRFWLETGAKPSPPPTRSSSDHWFGRGSMKQLELEMLLAEGSFHPNFFFSFEFWTWHCQNRTTDHPPKTTGPKLKPLLRPQLGGGCFFFSPLFEEDELILTSICSICFRWVSSNHQLDLFEAVGRRSFPFGFRPILRGLCS